MKRRTVAFSLLTVFALTLIGFGAFKSTSVAAGSGPSATGSGILVLPDGRKRQFSFSARVNANGTVTGQATIHNPNFDFRAHLDITCLQVVGNRASLGGAVRSNDPNLNGQNGFFTVYDNGEPGKGHDTISLIFFDPITAQACQSIGPDDFEQMPVDAGNIQVRQ